MTTGRVTGMEDDVAAALGEVARRLPGGGESRPGQVRMARAVGRAIADRRHLVVQAGTGTGKSLAYLVPAALAGETVVVATATKALQDQLADKDLPQVAAAIGAELTFAVLKGRSNYLCRQRASEVGGRGDQLTLPPGDLDTPDADTPARAPSSSSARSPRDDDPGRLGDQVRRLLRWADDSATGDRAELDFEPSPRAWAMVSTTARDCPGAFRCPSGQHCFAEDARARAAAADVIVVNTHLYGAHLASQGAVLPPHGVVVFDEAHEIEEVMTDCLGLDIGPGRFRALAATARTLVDGGAARAVDDVADLADLLQRTLQPLAGTRIPASALHRPDGGDGREVGPDGAGQDGDGGSDPTVAEPVGFDLGLEPLPVVPSRARSAPTPAAPGPSVSAGTPALGEVVALADGRVTRLVAALRDAGREGADAGTDADAARRDRAVLSAGHLIDDLRALGSLGDDQVAWVDGGNRNPVLRVSPIEVGPILTERLWGDVAAVLTSATVPLGLADRLGLDPESTEELDVGSPFDYEDHAMLYVARSLPDRRRPEAEPALIDELVTLINAAGGRTLALFTSWRAMTNAVAEVRDRVDVPVLAQSDLPKPALVEAFRADEATCLFATLGFWQGVDVPGRTLSLVTIDRIPFPRPDEPVLQARRDLAGDRAFRLVDLPRAGTLLAQGAGRLIRSTADRGVVAVLDSRLATASYRAELLARVPPMRRCVDRDEVVRFLREITGD